ncbi:MAG: F0F1 ATP synthase subunit B [Chloroflexaceae bacterium]|nr:F0F1 ATP synthase subunit B [Chloroflexaceae bacterium]
MDALGINWVLLLSQVINFGAMIVILHVLLYKPVLKLLGERTERIEQSLNEAEQVKAELANAKSGYEDEMKRARQEAAQIITQAQERAKAQEAEIIAQAREEGDRIRSEAREQTTRERDQMVGELKGQLADLVTLTASRVLQAEISAQAHRKLIEESLSALGRQN